MTIDTIQSLNFMYSFSMQYNKKQAYNQRNNQLIYSERHDFEHGSIYGHFACLLLLFVCQATLFNYQTVQLFGHLPSG